MPQAMRESAAAPAAPGEAVGPLERGLTVLRVMAGDPGSRHRASDLARATGLARSTIDRIAITLARLGYLRTEGRDLLLAPRLMELGNAYLASCGLPDVLEPYAVVLADELDESVSIAVPDGDGVRFITQATRRRAMSLAFRIGDLLPAERCAPGAVFAGEWDEAGRGRWLARRREDPLDTAFPAVPPRAELSPPEAVEAAFDARVREAAGLGWALDDQFIEPGLVAVAHAVRDPAGTAVCALSVVSHTSRHSARSLREHALPRLRRAAAAMEKALRTPPRPGPPLAAPEAADNGPKAELGPEFLQSLARGLAVLRALGSARGGLGLTAAAGAAGLPRASARRALITLEYLGYVRADGGVFTLLPRVLELGYAQLSRLSFGEIVRPHLAELTRQVHESASIAVLDGDDICYVERVPTSRIMSVDITVGTRFAAYATSMGRVLLAGLPAPEQAARLARIRFEPLTRHTVTTADALADIIETVGRNGYALVDEELEDGLRSAAMPLRDRLGHTVAAVNVSQHAGRATRQEFLETVLPPLAVAVARIEADLAVASERQHIPAT
ncbi:MULTISPECIES: IclR family transcriptional regulator C-terminal domain-containing protein [unclassified Streptomyces]|uniref:IclR family transcriptional regulator domain-containing protein n=1 Tax=unclassified Streptomyces TaxID=2593676 RepID=UPI002E13F100|nr:helix-turn-helix domain-containing protein [Streptomyces sp. NBC_01197]WSS53012.1 helix-turn-helix domain-containing protein [Streptomyces sp. NBC_01180]